MLKYRKVQDHKQEMQQRAVELRLKGLTYAEIGRELGISRQRVQQITRPPAQVYDFVKRRAESKCEDCKVPLGSGHIHHKHVTPLFNYNDIENLEYLCISCHRERHRKVSDGTRELMSQAAIKIFPGRHKVNGRFAKKRVLGD